MCKTSGFVVVLQASPKIQVGLLKKMSSQLAMSLSQPLEESMPKVWES